MWYRYTTGGINPINHNGQASRLNGPGGYVRQRTDLVDVLSEIGGVVADHTELRGFCKPEAPFPGYLQHFRSCLTAQKFPHLIQ